MKQRAEIPPQQNSARCNFRNKADPFNLVRVYFASFFLSFSLACEEINHASKFMCMLLNECIILKYF